MATTFDTQRTTVELLQRIAREDLPALIEAADQAGRFIPRHVERTVERFLTCGDSREGFAWLVCDDCDHHRLVPFSCNTRAICSSCGGRRMATRAAWLVDRVIPEVPVRQWVLTLPWARRLVLARRSDLLLGVLNQALDVIFAWYRYQAAERLGLPLERARDFRCGAVTQIQRFSSALSLNPHLHSLVPDGAWYKDEQGGLHFVAVLPPSTDDIEDLVVEIAERCERWLARQGFGEHDLHDDPDPEDAQMLLQAASAAGRAALGRRAGRRAKRIQVHRGRVYELPPRCAVCDGCIPLWSNPRWRANRSAGSQGARAALPLRRPSAPRTGAPRGAARWFHPPATEDPMVGRDCCAAAQPQRTAAAHPCADPAS